MVAKLDRVLDVAQPERQSLDARVAEVLGRAAARQHQHVPGEPLSVRRLDVAGRGVDRDDFAEPEARVRDRPQDRPNGMRDVLRREAGGRDLIEQRQERVVVLAIQDLHVDGRVGERARDGEAAEARADHDHALARAVRSDRAPDRLAQRRRQRERDAGRDAGVQCRHRDVQIERDVRDADRDLRERQRERETQRPRDAAMAPIPRERRADREHDRIRVGAVQQVEAHAAAQRRKPHAVATGRPLRTVEPCVVRGDEAAQHDLEHEQSQRRHQRAARTRRQGRARARRFDLEQGLPRPEQRRCERRPGHEMRGHRPGREAQQHRAVHRARSAPPAARRRSRAARPPRVARRDRAGPRARVRRRAARSSPPSRDASTRSRCAGRAPAPRRRSSAASPGRRGRRRARAPGRPARSDRASAR